MSQVKFDSKWDIALLPLVSGIIPLQYAPIFSATYEIFVTLQSKNQIDFLSKTRIMLKLPHVCTLTVIETLRVRFEGLKFSEHTEKCNCAWEQFAVGYGARALWVAAYCNCTEELALKNSWHGWYFLELNIAGRRDYTSSLYARLLKQKESVAWTGGCVCVCERERWKGMQPSGPLRMNTLPKSALVMQLDKVLWESYIISRI